jgi:signal transduction histidine kinase
MRARDRISGVPGSRQTDVAAAVLLGAAVLVYLLATDRLAGANNLYETACTLGVAATVAFWRSHPVPAAVVAGCLMAFTAAGNNNGVPTDLAFLPAFLLAYALGAFCQPRWPVLALAALILGLQVANGFTIFNPFVFVATAGPWALGLVVRSRHHLADQLAARSLELEAERELFAAEAVRYERARIARELHDIVAHCISVMVIQASAGQRLGDRDPELTTQVFDAITESVQQAEAEIGLLVELLEHDGRPRGAESIRLVDELVARAVAAGLVVTCRFAGSTDELPDEIAATVYRVVQEGLTNALRYAPGAPVDIAIANSGGMLEVSVVNGPGGTRASSGLERAGGGRGLAGMRERVQACGGDLTTGPPVGAGLAGSYGGGWQVRARLPVRSAGSRPDPGLPQQPADSSLAPAAQNPAPE